MSNPPKKEVFDHLLSGPSVFVHLDPRRAGVVVPQWFKNKPTLVLQVGLNMAVAIPDLKSDLVGVACTLSFNREPYYCRLPWTAIFALIGEDQRGMVWPEDVPSEVHAQYGVKPAAPAVAEPPPPPAAEGAEPAKKAKKPRKKKEKVAREPLPDNVRSLHSPKAELAPVEIAPPPPAPVAEPKPKAAPAAKKGKRELPSYLRVVK